MDQLGQPLLAEQQLGQLLLEEQQLGQLLLEELQVQQQGQVGLLDQVELQDAVSRAELAPQQAEQLLEQQAWASALPWPLPLAQLSVHELSPCDQKTVGHHWQALLDSQVSVEVQNARHQCAALGIRSVPSLVPHLHLPASSRYHSRWPTQASLPTRCQVSFQLCRFAMAHTLQLHSLNFGISVPEVWL